MGDTSRTCSTTATDYSLWLRQTTTTSNVQIVPSAAGRDAAGRDLHARWHLDRFRPPGRPARRPTCGACPFSAARHRPFVADVASPISWAPDGRRIAFLRTRFTPTLSSQLFVAAADGGQERQLASDVQPEPWISLVAPWRPSFAPAWSPDGRLIAVAA